MYKGAPQLPQAAPDGGIQQDAAGAQHQPADDVGVDGGVTRAVWPTAAEIRRSISDRSVSSSATAVVTSMSRILSSTAASAA